MHHRLKFGLLGKGKTGQFVKELNPDVTVFDRTNKLDESSINQVDILISFVTGEVFQEYIPLLIKHKKNVVSGSTGAKYPENLDKTLKENQLKWIWANNFSLGINVIELMLNRFSIIQDFYPEGTFSIHDIHHTKKLDAPSGTALSMEKWLKEGAGELIQKTNIKITSDRTGDVVGVHHCTFESDQEKLTLTHEAKNRGIFAKGALWSANIIATKDDLDYGFHHFSQVIQKYVKLT